MIVWLCPEESAQTQAGNSTLQRKYDGTGHDEVTIGSTEDYSFEALLRSDPSAIAAAKKRFLVLKDSKLKMRICSILISRGVQDHVYYDYLTEEAKKALSDITPWPINENIQLNDAEVTIIRMLRRFHNSATAEQIMAALPKEESATYYSTIRTTLQGLKDKGYIKSAYNKQHDERFQSLVAIRDVDTNYLQAYMINPAFVSWCQKHPQKPCDEWYQSIVYPDPDPWYLLAAAGDPRAYDLLILGLHSQNVGIAISAASGLTKLQDPRAVDEMVTVARREGYEAKIAMAEDLLYFSDAKAEAAAEELLDDKRVAGKRLLDIATAEAKSRGVRGLFPW